jgi:hypothetical protein
MENLQRNKRKVRAYQRLLKVANWIASLPNRVTPAPFRLLQIGSAFWQSRALYVAARLCLADEIGVSGKPVHEIAGALQLDEDHLYRLMRMLASIGVFAETEQRVFRHSRMSHYLRRDHPQSLHAMILMHNSPVMAKPWMESLEAGIRTGETPFELSHGTDLFTFMDRDATFDRLFSEAMDAVEALTGNDYLQDFDWRRFDRLIDVGGSKGAKALAILAQAPHLSALVFDRPQVIAQARNAWHGTVTPARLDRIEFVAGNMLDAIPVPRSDRDIYLFMAIFHGMGNDDAHKVLTNLRTAIGAHRPGILVVDMVAEESNIDPTVASFDMQMLLNTRGRERTLAEWADLFKTADFEMVQVIDVRSFAKFIVIAPH